MVFVITSPAVPSAAPFSPADGTAGKSGPSATCGQEQRVPCFPVNTVLDLMSDEHLAHREFFVEMEHPVAGALKYPGAAYKLSNSPLPLTARAAPILELISEVVEIE